MKSKKKKFENAVMLFVLILFLIFPFHSPAEERIAGDEDTKKKEDKKEPVKFELTETVVTATRMATPLEETTKSVDIVTAKKMEEQQQYFLPELMNNEPGVFLRQTGGIGQWAPISIRGASDRHTVFQYNGMPLRDSADTQGAFSYFTEDMFGTSNLDRIEILKGTNSTLYGSQAMGGVINIIPRKWQKGFAGELRSEYGSNNTYIENARLAYGQEKYYIDINPVYIKTDGEKYGGNNGFYYNNKGLTFGAGIKPFQNTGLEFSALVYDTDLALGNSPSLDASGNPKVQQADPNKHRESQLYQLSLMWNHEIAAFWDYSIKGSYGSTERHYFNLNTIDPRDQSNYDGETTYLEMQHNLHPTDWLTINIGADYDKAVLKEDDPSSPYTGNYTMVHQEHNWTTYDLFAQLQFALLDRSIFLTMGARYNHPEAFDNKIVWETSGAYILKATNTKFHAHVGTGYRTPSLYETYGGYVWNGSLVGIGNLNLKPEESTGYEFGIDQSFAGGKVALGTTYFQTNFENWIGFDSLAYKYVNGKEKKLSGLEAYIRTKPFDWLRLDLAYTYTDTRSEEDNGNWVRGTYQPYNKFNLITTLSPIDKMTVVCDVGYLDKKIIPLSDPSWNTVQWEEKSRWLVDIAATYKLLKFMDLFVRAKNLLDEDYTESGYHMPGRTVYGGVKFHF